MSSQQGQDPRTPVRFGQVRRFLDRDDPRIKIDHPSGTLVIWVEGPGHRPLRPRWKVHDEKILGKRFIVLDPVPDIRDSDGSYLYRKVKVEDSDTFSEGLLIEYIMRNSTVIHR